MKRSPVAQNPSRRTAPHSASDGIASSAFEKADGYAGAGETMSAAFAVPTTSNAASASQVLRSCITSSRIA
jgi:hypothetical protein